MIHSLPILVEPFHAFIQEQYSPFIWHRVNERAYPGVEVVLRDEFVVVPEAEEDALPEAAVVGELCRSVEEGGELGEDGREGLRADGEQLVVQRFSDLLGGHVCC